MQHIAEHGLTTEEVEEVLIGAHDVIASASSGAPLAFGMTSTGKYLAVIFNVVEQSPLAVRVVTAFEVEP